MKSICVYLGAKIGNNPAFYDSVGHLGRLIAEGGYRLVYGGSSLGLMGHLAKSALKQGGKVTGIMTKHLIDKEVPLDSLDEMIITDSMQERKQLLQKRSDAFMVMPGGLGTLEEAFETWNAVKIGLFNKPIGVLNMDGYFDELLTFMHSCASHDFLSIEQVRIPIVSGNLNVLFTQVVNALEDVHHAEYV